MKILVLTKRQYMGKDLLDDRFGRFRELPLEFALRGEVLHHDNSIERSAGLGQDAGDVDADRRKCPVGAGGGHLEPERWRPVCRQVISSPRLALATRALAGNRRVYPIQAKEASC